MPPVTSRDKALAALAAHHARAEKTRAELERETVRLIAEALSLPARERPTWEQIGAALNQKASNANRKYKPLLNVEQRVTPKPAGR